MPLRSRLTLLYSSLVMGVLLIFGSAVYLLVSVLLINHIDDQLEATVKDIVNVTRVNPVGDISIVKFPALDTTANVYVQIWGRNGRLMTSSPSLAQINESLDPDNLNISRPVFPFIFLGLPMIPIIFISKCLSCFINPSGLVHAFKNDLQLPGDAFCLLVKKL